MVDNDENIDGLDRLNAPINKTMKKKITITLSLNHSVLEELKKESLKEQISLSAKVSNILSKHIITYRFAQDTKSVLITKKTFGLIVDQLEEDLLLKDFTTNALDFIPTVFLSKNIPFTLDNIIKYALIGGGLEGGIFNHLHYYKDNQGYTYIVMRHHLGLKWSRILSKGQCDLIENMLGCQVSSTILPSSVTLKVPPLKM